MKKVFKNAETKLKESGIDDSNSGTCAISILIHKNELLLVIWEIRVQKEMLAIELSYDHKPIRPNYRERIEKSYGKIYRLTH